MKAFHGAGIVLVLGVLSACSVAAQQKNKYGMRIVATGGDECKIEKRELIERVVDLSEAGDLCAPYRYVPDQINDSDYTHCTTTGYLFKKYETHGLNMEIDLPARDTAPCPFIVYVHGGGWNTGDTGAFAYQSKYLASKGIAGIRITYTLNKNGGHFDLGLQEIAEAFAFIRKHAAAWNLDMTRFGFAAGSAGTPLAAYWAMKMGNCKLYIGCNGLYDFTDKLPKGSFPGNNAYLRNIRTEERRKAISAALLVPAQNPPAVLVVHGTADTAIPYRQSEALCDAVEARGGKTERLFYPYYTHGFFNRNASDKYEEITIAMYRFAKEVFRLK